MSPDQLRTYSHTGKFSVFRAPIQNTLPSGEVTLRQVWNAIRGNRYVEITHQLRQLHANDYEQYKILKTTKLDYATFGGTFTKRDSKFLTGISGNMCLDFDHLNNVTAKKRKLIADTSMPPKLIFISPGGDGLKVIIRNPYNSGNYNSDYCNASNHFFKNYGLKADATSDISRACFLCHDANAYYVGEDEEGWDNIRDYPTDEWKIR